MSSWCWSSSPPKTKGLSGGSVPRRSSTPSLPSPSLPSPSLPVSGVSLEALPRAVRAQVQKQVDRGQIQTLGELLGRLKPEHAAKVRYALIRTMPELADL